MNEIVDFLYTEPVYYSIISGAVLAYIFSLWMFKLPVLSFSSVNYFLAFILAMLPGYSAASGSYLPLALCRGFDRTIYLIYLGFSVTLTAASLLGQLIAKRYALIGQVRPNLNARVGIVLIFILVYGCVYFYWVPFIPLKNLLFATADHANAAEQRILITHQLGEMGSGLPWPFRYWRTVLQYWPVVLCFYLTGMQQSGVRFSRILYGLCLVGTALLVMFTLEKILIVQFVFGLLVIRGLMAREIKLGRLASIGAVCVLVSLGTIAVFMGGQIPDLVDALSVRINEQTSSSYVQIEYVREHGFLGLRSIQFPFGSSILGKDYFVDLGREAYVVIFPERSAGGIIGSAAGLSLADLYFAFGWFGLPVFGMMIAIHSWVDIAWRNGMMRSDQDQGFRLVSGAFYIFGMSMLSLTFVSSVFLILSPPFGLSAQCILIAILFVFLVKVSSLKILVLR